MATKRIKDISTTATTFAADDFIALDASSVGTRKMAKASLITQVGANYLEKADNLSDVASKDTSKLNLEVPNVGTAANEVSLNGMLNSGAWLDFDAFYQTGTWTPTLSFSGGSTGIALTSEGIYTRLGNTVCLRGVITLTDKGSDSGTARIGGLPHSTANTSTSYQTAPVMIFDASSLTSAVTGLFEDNQPNIILYQTSASGGAAVTNANFTNTTSIRFSGTYQIA